MAKRTAKIEIYRDSTNQWRARVRAANGQIVWVTEGYKRKGSAVNATRVITQLDDTAPILVLD